MILQNSYVSIWIFKSMHMNDFDENQMYEAQLIYPLGGAYTVTSNSCIVSGYIMPMVPVKLWMLRPKPHR